MQAVNSMEGGENSELCTSEIAPLGNESSGNDTSFKMSEMIEFCDTVALGNDIVKVGVWLNYVLDSNKNMHLPKAVTFFQTLFAWVCVGIQNYLTFELLLFLGENSPNNSVDFPFEHWIVIVVILIMATTDIQAHLVVAHFCTDALMEGKLRYLSSIFLLMAQIFQSVMVSYVAYGMIVSQENIQNLLTRFAGVMVLMRFDDIIGSWFLGQLATYKGMMKMRTDQKLRNGHPAKLMYEVFSKIASYWFLVIMLSTMIFSWQYDETRLFLIQDWAILLTVVFGSLVAALALSILTFRILSDEHSHHHHKLAIHFSVREKNTSNLYGSVDLGKSPAT